MFRPLFSSICLRHCEMAEGGITGRLAPGTLTKIGIMRDYAEKPE
ncbi:MAG: hypothetical protein ACM3SV_10620 [Betaproteobacteria bacterium]